MSEVRYGKMTGLHATIAFRSRVRIAGNEIVKRKRTPLWLFLFVCVCTIAGFCSATDIYITPTGTAQGVCTISPQPPSWFNTASNWGSGSTQIGPGTTVHLCGTFTGTANQQLLKFQGSGTSGNPITLHFESGTVLTAPYWANTGAIAANGVSYITIDGGTNGVITNSANGTSLANKMPSEAVNAVGCNNCEIKNLNISNIYIHVANESEASCSGEIDQSEVRAILFSGQNVLVHDNTINDVGFAIWDQFANGDTNHQIYNNNIYDIDHAIIFAGVGTSGVSLGESIHDNHVHDFANWDTGVTANCFHHDGLHAYGSSSTPALTLYFYNNLCDGNLGTNFNACMFMEGTGSGTPWTGNSSGSTYYAFNNVLVTNNSHSAIQTALGNGDTFVNNTVLCSDALAGDIAYGASASTANLFLNNAEQGCGYFVMWNSFGVSNISTSVDYNAYANAQGYNAFNYTDMSIDTSSFTPWKSSCGCDSHAVYNSSSLDLSTTYVPNSGSPVITSAKNLTSMCTGNLTALCKDKAGNARPTSGNWDAGAYQYNSSATPPIPTGVTASVN